MKYIGPGRDSKPYFGFATLVDETRYGYFNLQAKCIEANNFPTAKIWECNGVQFEVEMKNLRMFASKYAEGNYLSHQT